MCIDVMHVTDVCQVGDMASYRCVVCCGATGDPITFCHMSSSRASSVDMTGEKFKPSSSLSSHSLLSRGRLPPPTLHRGYRSYFGHHSPPPSVLGLTEGTYSLLTE
jgi:hypothetical protein